MPMTATMFEPEHAHVPEHDLISHCIEACFACAEACTACSEGCLSDRNEFDTLLTCIRLDLDCALICSTTGTVLARYNRNGSDARVIQAQVATCLLACKTCGAECARHAEHHDHCRICAEACEECEEACAEVLRMVKVH